MKKKNTTLESMTVLCIRIKSTRFPDGITLNKEGCVTKMKSTKREISCLIHCIFFVCDEFQTNGRCNVKCTRKAKNNKHTKLNVYETVKKNFIRFSFEHERWVKKNVLNFPIHQITAEHIQNVAIN